MPFAKIWRPAQIPGVTNDWSLRKRLSRQSRKRIRSILEHKPKLLPKYKLLPHQQQAVGFLAQNSKSVLLRIPMGLGKTLIALHYLRSVPGPAYYFCPAAIVCNVLDEISRFCPDIVVKVVSYRSYKPYIPPEAIVVLDECPISIGPHLTSQLKSARRVIAMTGNFKIPKLPFPFQTYATDRGILLPKCNYQSISIELTDTELDAYQTSLSTCKAKVLRQENVTKEYVAIRQQLAITTGKIETIRKLLKNTEHQTVIFSQFPSSLRSGQLALGGILVCDGKPEERQRILMSGETCWCYTALVGTGLNICNAETLIFLEPPGNKQIFYQVSGRIMRMNQKFHSVNVFVLTCINTIEEQLQKSNAFKFHLD